MSFDVPVDPSGSCVGPVGSGGSDADGLFSLPDLADLRVVCGRADDMYLVLERARRRLEAMQED